MKKRTIVYLSALLLCMIIGYVIAIGVDKYKQNQWIKITQTLVDEKPQDAGRWVSLGNAKCFVGDYASALNVYLKAFELDTNNIDAMQGIGMCYFNQQDWNNAEHWFNISLVLARKIKPEAVSSSQCLLDLINKNRSTNERNIAEKSSQ